jgi:hypothetical protein
MIDRPIIGQIGRTDQFSTTKLEIIGQLDPDEWACFIACVKACAASYGNRLTVSERTYRVPIKVLRFLPKKKLLKKAKGRPKRAGRRSR